MENLSPRTLRLQQRHQRQQEQQQSEPQSESPRQTIFVQHSQSQSPQFDNDNNNENDNGIIIHELSPQTDSLLQTESVSVQSQQPANNNQQSNNNNQAQFDNINENNDNNNNQSNIDNINQNNNNNINNQQQLQFEDLGFLSNDYYNSFTLSLNGFYNAIDDYQTAIYKCGVFAENINYVIQKNKRFSKRFVNINGNRIKFTYSAIMGELFIGNVESEQIMVG